MAGTSTKELLKRASLLEPDGKVELVERAEDGAFEITVADASGALVYAAAQGSAAEAVEGFIRRVEAKRAAAADALDSDAVQ